MYRTLRRTLTGLLLIAVCGPCGAIAEELNAQLLVYRVTEPGVEPYISRILVTPQYLRLDQGENDDGFILLDRGDRTIYSVNAADATILQIDPAQGGGPSPADRPLTVERAGGAELPKLAGRNTEHWRFSVAGRLCRNAVVAPGLMPKATSAYGEYLELLAGQHAATLEATPPEMRDPCDLALHVYEPRAAILKGLPLREWDEQGGLRELIDYREAFPVSGVDFKLPATFQRTRMQELRTGL